MRSKIGHWLLCLAVLLFAVNCPAATWQVTQSGAGSGDGSTLGNAASMLTANTTLSLSPDDVVTLNGTFTSRLSATTSGTSGHPIVYKFSTAAQFSAPTQTNNTAWITLDGHNYITIDGGASGQINRPTDSPLNINGIIQLTSNGTLPANGGSSLYCSNVGGISCLGCTGITVENLVVSNMYNRQSATEAEQNGQDGFGVYGNQTGITVSNCIITGCQNCVSLTAIGVASEYIVVNNCLSNFVWGIDVGAGASGQLKDLFMVSNYICGGDMYESTVDVGIHRDPIILFGVGQGAAYGGFTNVEASYNFITMGQTPQSTTAGTAGIFCDDLNITNMRVFNNVSTLAASLDWADVGAVSANAVGGFVANNTVYGWIKNGTHSGGAIGICASGTNMSCLNNIVQGSSGALAIGAFTHANGTFSCANAATFTPGCFWSDYNIFNYQGANSFDLIIYDASYSIFGGSGLGVDTLAEWQGANSCLANFAPALDVHSTTDVPAFLPGTFIPSSLDTVARGKGTNLWSWGITNDFLSRPRSPTGAFDIGAFVAGIWPASGVVWIGGGNISVSGGGNISVHP